MVLSLSWLYQGFQDLVGAKRVQCELVKNYIQPACGANFLDLGCGPAEILNALPRVNYTGVDLSGNYIATAKAKFGQRGRFFVGNVTQLGFLARDRFDIILCIGLLHHLDDNEVLDLFNFANSVLGEGGRLITLDGCFVPGQSSFAVFMLQRDRGQNVRSESGYISLARSVFPNVRSEIRHDMLRIPYTHIILQCSCL